MNPHRNQHHNQHSSPRLNPKISLFVGILLVCASLLQAQAQSVEGFAQLGLSKGFSIFGALQATFNLAQNLNAGSRVELVYADGNGSINDNPKLEVQPFITYDAPILAAQDYYLSGGATLRPYLRVFSTVANATPGVGYDLQVRLQPALNGSIALAPSWRAYGGVGGGLQMGLIPTPGILYSFLYSYGFVKGDLGSVLPKLQTSLGFGSSLGFSSSFVPGDLGYSLYGNLEYGLAANMSVILQAGYSSGNSSASFDTPESNGFYGFLRGSFRL
jgi:hypothetical protein